ncbi:precorrin-3B synthase [Streptomyces sp. NPDC048409]|uniref:precorrin-3B synthase n=1 Tax=Streptomyces sp. NPDC048409 TaxID=3154723 RepID=UPI003429D5B4
MSTADLPPTSQATAVSRDRGDACPGSLRLHPADDGALARIRIPGGVLTLAQARALGDAAERLGDGCLSLTSRGNVQLRGLTAGCGGDLVTLLAAAGLLPSPAHERVRNIVASPLSGLDGRGLRDVRPWLTGLDAALCASETALALSGRFLFALDDGRGDVAGLGADVTVRATADGVARLAPGAVLVAAEDVPRAALAAAETFLALAAASGTRAWRMVDLPVPEGAWDMGVRRRLTDLGIGHVGSASDLSRTDGPPPGVRGDALSVHVPLGRLSARQWRELTAVAHRELRLTPWRGVVLPLPGEAIGSLSRLEAAGLVTDPSSPWPRVGACVGTPGCARSHADVRADATRALRAADASPLPLYWSGCERRCGRPHGEHIDVIATPGHGYRLSAAPSHDSHLAAVRAAITS